MCCVFYICSSAQSPVQSSSSSHPHGSGGEHQTAKNAVQKYLDVKPLSCDSFSILVGWDMFFLITECRFNMQEKLQFNENEKNGLLQKLSNEKTIVPKNNASGKLADVPSYHKQQHSVAYSKSSLAFQRLMLCWASCLEPFHAFYIKF